MEEYLKRSGRYAKIDLKRLKEKSRSSTEQTASDTWKEMKKELAPPSLSLLLDPSGQEISTEDLVRIFQKAEQNHKASLVFFIGGSYGLPNDAKGEVHQTISLSPLTLPHRIALLVLLEQIYRVLSIRAGTPYHH